MYVPSCDFFPEATLIRKQSQKRYEHVLMSYGVQAAWRLGKWDVLHKLVSTHLRSLTEETSTAPVITPGSPVEGTASLIHSIPLALN